MIVYTLWAAEPESLEGFWMIEARDEFSWEGNPEACEQAFKDAQEAATKNGWVTREISLHVSVQEMEAAFQPDEIKATVETEGGA